MPIALRCLRRPMGRAKAMIWCLLEFLEPGVAQVWLSKGNLLLVPMVFQASGDTIHCPGHMMSNWKHGPVIVVNPVVRRHFYPALDYVNPTRCSRASS